MRGLHLMSSFKRSKHERMTESKARTIKAALAERDRLYRLIKENYSDKALSGLANVSKRQIQDIHAGRSWAHVKI